jgi:glyoxylase-like metal-dependent hydrolase (beta-lactamase superfamily II)
MMKPNQAGDDGTMQFQQITDRVWWYPHDPEAIQPGVGAVITNDRTILIDAGNGPPHARMIRAALVDMDAPPVRHVIYTHFHYDHTFGGQVWVDSVISAHVQCRTLLLERYGQQPWSRHYIEGQSILEPDRAGVLRAMDQAVGDWQRFRLMPPHITFTSDMQLAYDDVTLTLKHIGGHHAADSITVAVDGVLFIGDCYYPPPPSQRLPGDTLDYAMIQHLLDQRAEVYIEGHNVPMTHAEFAHKLTQT